MKAERRHELQTNSLARFLENLPLYFRFHFGKLLLGALVIILLIVLIRYRMTSGQVARERTFTAMNDVRRAIGELPMVDLTQPTPEARAQERRRIATQVEGAIDEILAQTDDGPEDAGLRAEAMVARGDLHWQMANLPAVPGAATQPALQMPRTAEQHLAEAADSYERVIREYPDRPMSVLTAMFGLAAIAENRGDWDAARAQYQAILDKQNVPQSLRVWAAERMQILPSLQEPLFTGNLPPRPTTLPDGAPAPAATQPTTLPSVN